MTGRWQIQTNDQHSLGVAHLASRFSDKFGMASWGKVLGLLHDKGKESHAFQQHIKKESGFDPSIRVDGDYHHAYVGGILARHMYGKSADNLLVNQIASHHTGLHDSSEIDGIIQKAIPTEVNQDVPKIVLQRAKFKSVCKEDFHHLSRMLYSCLVDADYLDTEAFMDIQALQLRKHDTSLRTLLPMLERYMAYLQAKAKSGTVNDVRREVLSLCTAKADTPVGIYSLTVPTGGGKTLSSLVWAIRHAVRNGQERIIIAIPYTSIIIQTAAVLRAIFGDDNVLEHHSQVDPELVKDSHLREKLRMAAENWDYPIVVTTNVQLFESIYSNKPSSCRKLHNIVNSVIVLDEVQTLPMDFLQPVVNSLKTYNKLFHVSVLLTTASQPVLSGLIEGCNPEASFMGMSHVTELVPNELKLHERLRRVKLFFDDTGKSFDEVAQQLCRYKRVLCVVNTRNDAKELYGRLPNEGKVFHLSKMMCPAHIRKTIESIKKSLENNDETIVRVISTQLIEAGVDMDFPVVFRQEAGLDSVLQAAGRCNREGTQKIGETYVFSLSKEHNLPRGDIQVANVARLSLGKGHDWFSPETMTNYFRQLYSRRDTFDKKNIKQYLYNPNDLCFATAAHEFRLIEDEGVSVVVCWENSMELVKQLLDEGPSYKLMKKLSQYMVNVHQPDFKVLQSLGVVSERKEGLFVVDYKQQYDAHIGLRIDNNWANEVLTV